MNLLLSAASCEGFECPLNVILFTVVVLMVLLCVGVYPGSCLFGKGQHNKICGCFSLSFCGSLWELYYYNDKQDKTSEESKSMVDEEDVKENFMDTQHRYNMRDRKKNLNFTEEELIF